MTVAELRDLLEELKGTKPVKIWNCKLDEEVELKEENLHWNGEELLIY